MSHLVVAEYNETGLTPAALTVVSAASKLGGAVDLFVAGHGSIPTDAIAKVAGLRKILVVNDAKVANRVAETLAPTLVGLASSYQSLLAAADSFGKNLMPRVAALLDCQQISDIIAIHPNRSYDRPIYAGNAIATVSSQEKHDIITVRTTAFEAAATSGGSASVEAISLAGGSDKARWLGADIARSERPELTSAKIVISGGRGMQSGDNFTLLEKVADKLGAAVGASRAAVDAGFVSNDYQVGQTGKVVAPELYIAVGISGAIQHLAGMKDSKVIVAINKDEEAPIFQVADYGLVADLFEAVPALEKELG